MRQQYQVTILVTVHDPERVVDRGLNHLRAQRVEIEGELAVEDALLYLLDPGSVPLDNGFEIEDSACERVLSPQIQEATM